MSSWQPPPPARTRGGVQLNKAAVVSRLLQSNRPVASRRYDDSSSSDDDDDDWGSPRLDSPPPTSQRGSDQIYELRAQAEGGDAVAQAALGTLLWAEDQRGLAAPGHVRSGRLRQSSCCPASSSCFTRGSAALAAQGCGRAHRWRRMRFAVQRALCHVMSAARLHKDGGMAAAGDSGGDSGPHLVAFCRRPLNHTHSTHLLSRRDTHNKCV